jgi:hypothetical protein
MKTKRRVSIRWVFNYDTHHLLLRQAQMLRRLFIMANIDRRDYVCVCLLLWSTFEKKSRPVMFVSEIDVSPVTSFSLSLSFSLCYPILETSFRKNYHILKDNDSAEREYDVRFNKTRHKQKALYRALLLVQHHTSSLYFSALRTKKDIKNLR